MGKRRRARVFMGGAGSLAFFVPMLIPDLPSWIALPPIFVGFVAVAWSIWPGKVGPILLRIPHSRAVFDYLSRKEEEIFGPHEILENKEPFQKTKPTTKPKTPSIFDAWDLVDQFTVAQASCLWCEVEPGLSHAYQKGNNPKIGAIEQMIVSEAKAGRVTLDSSKNALEMIGDYAQSYVDRNDLVGLAQRKNQKPKFLFPEER